jgi:hypothetical protein
MCQIRNGCLTACCLLLAFAAGCADARPEAAADASAVAETGTHFDPTTAGTLRGRVTWDGPIPNVPPFEVPPDPLAGPVRWNRRTVANPNAPLIDPRTRGVRCAVVFLRGVDPGRAKPWDLPPVTVEQRDCRIRIVQGEAVSPIGFARRAEVVTMVSRDACFHALHAGGAALFSLMFPDPDQPLARRLNEKGLVEWTSGAGYYWMRAYLFVDDHPYYTRTDAAGQFVLEGVPPGHYEVVCWLPNWEKAGHERDPESGLITRYFFAAPLERVQSLNLGAGQTREVSFTLSAAR